MDVLLLKSCEAGDTGELIKVKPGYARNYLFPRHFAILADTRNKKLFEHKKRIAEAQKLKDLIKAQELAKIISSLSLTIQKPVGAEDKIFGSVTTLELAHAFENMGHKIDRRAISIDEDIKRLGVYKGTVKLHPKVTAQFSIWVIAQQTEVSV